MQLSRINTPIINTPILTRLSHQPTKPIVLPFKNRSSDHSVNSFARTILVTSSSSSSFPKSFLEVVTGSKPVKFQVFNQKTSEKKAVVASEKEHRVIKPTQNLHVSKPKKSVAVQFSLSSAISYPIPTENQAFRPDATAFYRHYNGKIVPHFQGLQYVYVCDVINDIYFSQKTVSDFSTNQDYDVPLDTLADQMFVKFKRDINYNGDGALDVVFNEKNGTVTSLDNRRLLIAQKIAVFDRYYGIWIRVHGAEQLLYRGLQKRFLGAKTWGEAAALRINKKKLTGFKLHPVICDHHGPKKVQTIPLCITNCDLSELASDDIYRIRKTAKNGILNI